MAPTTETRITTLADFVKWADRARPGSRCVYHIGLLALDADRNESLLSRVEQERVAGLKSAAWAMHGTGDVKLVQRREDEESFAYIAVRTSKAARKPASQPVALAA